MAMIIQEPMTSLNPVLSIGFQVCEALVTHRSLQCPEHLSGSVREPQSKAFDWQIDRGAARRVQQGFVA